MENLQSTPAPAENILDEMDYYLAQANAGRRFFNLLIDRVIIYLLWRFPLFKLNVAFLVLVYRYTESRALLYIFGYVLYIAFFVIIQSSFETFAHGKTIGKWVTGTRAVNQDGTPITSRTAILRGLSRLVPFEAFSALGSPCFPWHDRWTSTYVINEQESSLPV